MLNDDINQSIFSFLSIKEVYQIKINIQQLNIDILFYCKNTNIEKIIGINNAVAYGFLEVVKFFHSIGKNCDDLMDLASLRGNLNILQYLHSIGKNGDVNAINLASLNGHLEVVKYLFSIGKDCTEDAMDYASRNGHNDIVKYLTKIFICLL